MDMIEETIRKGKSPKEVQHRMARGKQQIISLKDKQDEVIKCREKMIRVEEFYKELYSSKIRISPVNATTDQSGIPEIVPKEVEYALKNMKRGKAPGEDGKLVDLLKDAGEELHTRLAHLVSLCIKKGQLPESWCNAIVILLQNKGNKKELSNCRPISLLSNIYKLFLKIPTHRLTKSLDDNQPREQAGFRSGYSTLDHLHTINQLIEKTNEFNKQLCLAFVDYEKAFGSVEQ